MKRKLRWGEGWLIAAALALVFALSYLFWQNRQPRTQFVAPVHSVSMEELERAGRINVNAASASELDELPGIGPALAAAIIEYREEHGPFTSAEELMEVYGIGEATLEGMLPFLRLD